MLSPKLPLALAAAALFLAAASRQQTPPRVLLGEGAHRYEWVRGWGMLQRTASPHELVNIEVQDHAHQDRAHAAA